MWQNAVMDHNFVGVDLIPVQGPFSLYGWARSQPMNDHATYVTSSLICLNLDQP